MNINIKKQILNLGCGNDSYGTHRIDMFETPTTTQVVDIANSKLPFTDQYFDEVRMWGVLEHLKNVGFLIDEVYRVCKKGALIDLKTDYAGWLFWHISKKREHNKYLQHYYIVDEFKHEKGTDGHHYLFVESHLKHHFYKFSNIQVSYEYHASNPMVKFLLKLLPNHMGAREINAIITK